MKLYTCKIAPNARKVTLYLEEKGIIQDVEQVEVNLMAGEQNDPAYRALNPLGKVPVLQLDDGSCITESLSIIEYFEDVYPENPLTGHTGEDRAKIKAIERFIDQEVMGTMGIIAHHKMPLFAERFKPSNDVIEYGMARQAEALDHLESFIGQGPFVMGQHFSLADITLYVTMGSAHLIDAGLDPKYKNISRCLEATHQKIISGEH